MKVYLKSRGVTATAEYDINTNECVVLVGSQVTSTISHAPTFRSKNTVEKKRKEYVVNGVVSKDAPFKSPSIAACFVTGSSTNGYAVWKTEEGITIGDLHKNR